MYDVIVVGAGIMGSSTACTLAKRGQKTLLIDQFPLPHTRGSSQGASRITRQAYYEQFNSNIMSVATPMWRELEKESGMVLFRKTGLLITSADVHSLSRYHETIHNFYKTRVPLMDQQTMLLKYQPMRVPAGESGCFDPEAGILYASKCLQAFQKVYENNGGVIADNHKVLDITPGDTVTVHTDKGTFQSKGVVLTCGPWAPQMLSKSGISLPLEAKAIQVLYWKGKPGADLSKLPCFINDSESNDIYGLPPDEYNNMMKILLHDGRPCDPDLRDQINPVDEAKDLSKVKEFVAEIFPDLIPEPAIVERCLYTCTPDNTAVVDIHPIYKNIAFGTGFSGQGFKQAPVIGTMLADLVLHQKTSSLLVDEMRAARFYNKSKL